MSSNLKWRPLHQSGHDLSDALKYALRKRGDRANTGKSTMDAGDVPYLEGLLHGGIEDAQKLIDAIEKYDSIEVWEQY